MLPSWKRFWLRAPVTPLRRTRPPRVRPRLESLEDRTLLSFDPPVNYPVGMAPRSLVVRDLNRAGLIGAIVANSGSNNVSVLLSNGDGTLRAGGTFATGTNPVALAMADLNGDGNPDLVVANSGSNNISVLLGNGDGTFRPHVDLPVGLNPSSVAIADFRGTGKLDLVVANRGDNTVSLLLGNGDGTFENATAIPMGSGPVAIATGNFADNNVGIVTANQQNNTVSVRLGNGDGTFGNSVNYAVGTSPSAVSVANLTGAGRQDIVVADAGSNDVNVLLGNGDGTFRSPMSFAAGLSPSSVAVRDINNRNKRDLIVSNLGSNDVSVLLGNGDGTFLPAVSYGVGSGPSAVAIDQDLDGNGTPDMVVANRDSNNVSVRLNHPEATKFVITADGTAIAGSILNFTVAAKENFNNVVTTYTGTIHFTSNDPQAVLPGDYTFVSSDRGMHTFTATLKTAGIRTITAMDTSMSSISGTSPGIQVMPAAANRLVLTGPDPTVVGAPITIGVTALDPFNNTATGYTGQIHFTSSDPRASLPPDFTFAPTDNGAHAFAVNLNTVGSISVTATDLAASSIAGSVTVVIAQASTTTAVTSSIKNSNAGQSVTFTATVNVVAPGLGSPTGTITFMDGNAALAVLSASSGTATFTTAALAVGKHAIKAVYSGDASFLASTSAPITQLVGGTNERFVAQTYLDLLHRPVDSFGLANWTSLLNAGAFPAQVVFAIEASIEYRTVIVQSLYSSYLRRQADTGGLQFFVGLLGAGRTVEDVRTIITGSAEYFLAQGGGRNDGFLRALYRDGLGRDIDSFGLDVFGRALAAGVSRAQVAAVIFSSPEYLQNLVQGFYQSFLHRPADVAGLNSFLSAIQQGAPDEEIIALIVGSPEYQASV